MRGGFYVRVLEFVTGLLSGAGDQHYREESETQEAYDAYLTKQKAEGGKVGTSLSDALSHLEESSKGHHLK